jgi:hypothetical protein
VSDVYHVVGIDGSERSETITHDGEQGDQDTVDDVHNIDLLAADIDPADEKQNPREAE